MKRILTIVCAALGMALSVEASAQVIDRVYAKDGSVYNGYIKVQEPGKRILVDIESASVFVNNNIISTIHTKEYELSEVSETIQNWVKENRPTAKTIELIDVKLNNGFQFNKAIQLEKGARFKLFITEAYTVAEDQTTRLVSSFEFQWDQVMKTEKVVNKDRKMGVHEVVTLKSGEAVKGYIVEQVIGVELRILDENNEIRSIRVDDVESIETKALNSDSSLWSQLMMFDEVLTKDGQTIRGLISLRKMGQSVNVLTLDGKSQTIALQDIAQYTKVPNKDYLKEEQNERERSSRRKTISEEPQNAISDEQAVSESVTAEKESKTKSTEAKTTKTERSQRTAKTSETSAYDYVINGNPVTLNVVTYGSKETNVLTQPVVDKVKVGESIRIEVPSKTMSQFELQVIRTVERPIEKLNVSVPSNRAYAHSWNKKDLSADSAIGFGLSFSNGKNILTLKCDKPGVYVVLPMVESNKCVAFEVTK
ncbi:MAG: hypothetical protein J6K81_02895 [Rikenellaceae bacterium]|nr:hypothetical protein [Rikenellaceae bacterium]